MASRIDVHHHIVPPRWLAEERGRMSTQSVHLGTVSRWSPQASLEAMDANGICTAITSLSTVITRPNDPEAASTLARECNEYAVRLARDHPGRFGTFAHLPLPHVDACLREIEYCAGALGVDGFRLQSSYGDRWPGDPAFDPVFAELDKRNAVVFVHPTAPACCASTVPGVVSAVMEFPFDTTRAIASLLFNGVFTRYPRVRFIFTHGGGTLPMLAHRMLTAGRPGGDHNVSADTAARDAFARLFFDIVSVTNAPAMAALRTFAPPSQLLFGTDSPYVGIGTTVTELEALKLDDALVSAIEHENALRLLPNLISA
jgi:predicted TIM-barrel fold metal-dependent hydrolase